MAQEEEARQKAEAAAKDAREAAEKAQAAAQKKAKGGRKLGGGQEHREEWKDAWKGWLQMAEDKKKELQDGILQVGEWYCFFLLLLTLFFL